jgi:hypothetical protein
MIYIRYRDQEGLESETHERLFHVTTSVQTPGHAATKKWLIHREQGVAMLKLSECD